MPKNHHCSCGRSHLLTPVPLDNKVVIDALTLKKIALLVGQSFYDVQLSRTNEVFLTSLDNYLSDLDLGEEEANKSSTLLNAYCDSVRDLLQDTERALLQAVDQLSFILAASGHGPGSGKRDDE